MSKNGSGRVLGFGRYAKKGWVGRTMDPVLLSVLILVVAAIVWNYALIRSLDRRLTALEKQHLALVAELEERMLQG